MKSFPFVFLLLLLASCRFLGPKTEVEGRVYDKVADKPVPGVRVRMHDDGSYITSGRGTIDELETDENGNFKFDFYANNINQYTCEIYLDHDSVWLVNKSSSSPTIQADQYNYVQVDIAPKCKSVGMKAYLKNLSEIDGWGWRAKHSKFLWWLTSKSAYNDSLWHHFPIQDSVGLAYGLEPYGTYYYEWYVVKNGDTTFYQDTVYAPRGGQGIIRKTF